MKQKEMIITAAIAVVVGGAAFFGGMKYQQSRTFNNFRQFAGGNGGMGMRNNGGLNEGNRNFGMPGGSMMRPVAGDIISTDDKSITVKLPDGSSKIVLVPDSAQINKAAQGAKTDLTVGQKVSVFGATNSDGSVTAQNIQLNPPQRNSSQ